MLIRASWPFAETMNEKKIWLNAEINNWNVAISAVEPEEKMCDYLV